MTTKSLYSLFVFAVVFATLGSSAQETSASLIGQEADIEVSFDTANPGVLFDTITGGGPPVQFVTQTISSINNDMEVTVTLGAEEVWVEVVAVPIPGSPFSAALSDVDILLTNLSWGATPGVIVGMEVLDSSGRFEPLSSSAAGDTVSLGFSGVVNQFAQPNPPPEFVHVRLLVQHVPEPSTAALALLGLLAFGQRRRRA